MLFKLLKYELKGTYKLFLLIWLASFCFIIASAGLPVFSGFGLLFIFAGLLFSPVYLGIRYRKSIYGSEGYFLMSVPTSSFTLIGAKLINGIIWLTGSILVLALGTTISQYIFKVNTFGVMDALYSIHTFIFSIQGFTVYLNLVGAIALLYFTITLSHLIPYRSLGVFVGALTFVVMAYGIQYGLGKLFIQDSLIFYRIEINYMGYLLSLFALMGVIYVTTALMVRKKLELV